VLTDVMRDVQKLKQDVASIQQTLADLPTTKNEGDEKDAD
jgi:hypothetical protein